jgi:hypothetical protein
VKNSREPERISVPRRRLGLALGLLSILALGGWSDCCCSESPIARLDPLGWGPKVQPYLSNVHCLAAVDSRVAGDRRVFIPGYRPEVLDGTRFTRLGEFVYPGDTLRVDAAVNDNNNVYVGTQEGLFGSRLDYGGVFKFDGLSFAVSAAVLVPGGILVGLDNPPVGTNLIAECDLTSKACTFMPSSPRVLKFGDKVSGLQNDNDSAFYAWGSFGLVSQPKSPPQWFMENVPAGPVKGFAGVTGNFVALTGDGVSQAGGMGTPWSPNIVGLGPSPVSCNAVIYRPSSDSFDVACAQGIFTRARTANSWTPINQKPKGTIIKSLAVAPDGALIAATDAGAEHYSDANGFWSLLDCLSSRTFVTATSFQNGTLTVGSHLGVRATTDDGTTWTSDATSENLPVRQIVFTGTAGTGVATYFTGSKGTYYRAINQPAFQMVTSIPTGGARSLGVSAGGTVFAGLSAGGVGLLSGMTFSPANSGFDTSASVNGFAAAGSTVVALTDKGNYVASNPANPTWTKGPNRADGQPFVGLSGAGLPDGTFLLGGQGNPPGWNIAISNPQGTSLAAAGQGIPDGAAVNGLLAVPNPPSFSRDDERGEAAAALVGPATVLFAATSLGVYVSYDGAASWSLLSRALGTAAASSLAVEGNRIWIGTADRGLTSYSLPIRFRRLVPIVLDVATASAHFTTELALTNRGMSAVDVTIQYTASLGSGSGTVTDSLSAGQQRIIPDVIAYLRQKGLSIPVGGAQGGTLLLTFPNVAATQVPSVTARTTTATVSPLPVGRAGLAYAAVDPQIGTNGALTVFGLRSNAADRSNVAVFNTSNADVTFKVTAYSGTGNGASAVVAAADTLPAWGWHQYNRILDGPGFAQGWVTVERTSTTGSFGIYGVVNDNTTNDASLIQPARGSAFLIYTNIPVLVETASFGSELILANSDTVPAVFHLEYAESLTGSGSGSTDVTVAPGTQVIIPGAIAYLRSKGLPIGAPGGSYSGSLHIAVSGASPARTFVGARTSSPAAGGEFGVYTPAFAPGAEADAEAVVPGLRADSENRSNVAAANVGGPDAGSITLSLQAYDGDAGGVAKGAPATLTLAPGRWQQINNILAGAGVSNGWVKITRTSGTAPWVGYGVVNDGGAPGQRTGDGAYVPMEN